MSAYSCSICFTEYSTDERSLRAPRILRCGHTFCSGCLIRILETTSSLVCPKCRHDATTMKEIPPNKALIQLIAKERSQKVKALLSTKKDAGDDDEGKEEEGEGEGEKGSEKSVKIFRCLFPGCKEVFTSKESLSKHIAGTGHSYSSNYKGFKKGSNYSQQQQRRVFKCHFSGCNESFSTKEDLMKHIHNKGHACKLRK